MDYPRYDVVLVDNCSTDESLRKIHEFCDVNGISVFRLTESEATNCRFPKLRIYELKPNDRRMILIRNRRNYGFAKGCNIGAFFSINVLKPDFILFINNDAIIPDRGLLKKMVDVCRGIKNFGALGVKIVEYYSGEVWCLGGGRVSMVTGDTKHIPDSNGEILECDYVTGCCMLVRSDVFKKFNGFDERYFCYYEDVDLSVRFKKAGLRNVCAKSLNVYHKVSRSSGALHVYYMTRNRILFIKLHNKKLILIALLYSVVKPFKTVIGRGEGQPSVSLDVSIPHYVRGLMDALTGRWGVKI